MRDLAIRNGIDARIYHQRIRAGWAEEKAATQPVQRKYTGEYAIYQKGEIAFIGFRKECAEFLGVQESYIRWMTTPTGMKRIANRMDPENATAAVKLDEDDE